MPGYWNNKYLHYLENTLYRVHEDENCSFLILWNFQWEHEIYLGLSWVQLECVVGKLNYNIIFLFSYFFFYLFVFNNKSLFHVDDWPSNLKFCLSCFLKTYLLLKQVYIWFKKMWKQPMFKTNSLNGFFFNSYNMQNIVLYVAF